MGVAPTTSISPDVFFPIEIMSREYAGHILLAVELASRGRTSVIGHKGRVARVMERAGNRGLLFYKTSRGGPTDEYWNQSWASGGGKQNFVGQDPEAGIVYTDYQDFFSQRPSFREGSTSRAQFCFGPDDYTFLANKFPRHLNRIHPTGSPRLSLWGKDGDTFYAEDSALIRERFGRCVLFASSGGFTHERYLKMQRLDPEREWSAATQGWHFASMALRAAREFDIPVIVRPHPTDSWTAWSRFSAEIDNLYVTTAFDLGAWTRISRAVVQPGGSTAAFEAVCAGIPAISTQTAVGQSVPAEISHKADNETNLLELLDAALLGTLSVYPTPKSEALVRSKVLHPLSGAAHRIADVIDAVAQFDGPSAVSRKRRLLSTQRRSTRGYGTRIDFEVQEPFKRPILPLERVEKDTQRALDILGRKDHLRIHQLDESCFRLSI